MDEHAARRYRFGVFEVDVAAGELRRQGLRVRLHRQPFEVLCLLLERPGEVLTREEISRVLWRDGTFVDYEHGVNAAVNRLRDALRDKASAPLYVETLPRRGYRFLGSVEVIAAAEVSNGAVLPTIAPPVLPPGRAEDGAPGTEAAGGRWLASVEDLPQTSRRVVETLFLLLQVMYLSFYVGALANLGEIRELLAGVPREDAVFWALCATAGVLIPARIFLICGVLFRPPRMRARYLLLWPFLLGMDLVWSLSPFLLLHHMSYGLALACVAPLVYSPFAQRSLVLMGAMGEG